MNKEMTSVHEPLFHISKRNTMPIWKKILIKAVAILIGLLFAGIIFLAFYNTSPLTLYYEMINGNFILKGQVSELFKETALLLGVSVALMPAFKMKFWNLGGNGQILVGALISAICVVYFGNSVSEPLLLVIMVLFSIIAGAVWAVIPAIFKAKWNTNETLFTLMMNYIAAGLIVFFISATVKGGSGIMPTLEKGHLPIIFGDKNALTIITVAVIALLVAVYMRFTKHGYEISVVGESQNTAKYVGINVKKVVIRTLILSGAICGLIGFLLTSAFDHSVSADTARNLGFTAIIAVWIAHMDPIATVISSFGIAFLTQGMAQAQSAIGIKTDEISSMIIGIVYFIIIGSDFFISYIVKLRSKKKVKEEA